MPPGSTPPGSTSPRRLEGSRRSPVASLRLQPHGFEGLGLARVNPEPPQLAVTQCPHVRLALLDGYAASLSPTTRTKHRDHVVPCVDPLIDLRPQRVEGGYPLTEIVSDAVQAAIDAIVEHIVDFDLRVVEAENRLVVAPSERF